jgi:hypothetical protein
MIKPKSERLRKWFTGTLIAAVTAAVIQVLTGAFTSLGSRVQRLISNEEPIHTAVASGQISFAKTADYSYVIPKSVEQLPPPPSYPADPEEKFDQWAATAGGVDAHTTYVLVTVQGRESAVVLTGLRVRVVQRRPPLRGISVTKPNAGPLELRYFQVNLDATPVTVEAYDDTGEAPVSFPYKVSQTEAEVLYIFASTEECDCSWVAELFWMANGKAGSTVLDDNGRPFRTTAPHAANPIYHFGDRQLHRFETQ